MRDEGLQSGLRIKQRGITGARGGEGQEDTELFCCYPVALVYVLLLQVWFSFYIYIPSLKTSRLYASPEGMETRQSSVD